MLIITNLNGLRRPTGAEIHQKLFDDCLSNSKLLTVSPRTGIDSRNSPTLDVQSEL